MMVKKKEETPSKVLPALDTIVISRGLDGEVSLKISRNLTYREAAWLVEEAMAMMPVDEEEDDDES